MTPIHTSAIHSNELIPSTEQSRNDCSRGIMASQRLEDLYMDPDTGPMLLGEGHYGKVRKMFRRQDKLAVAVKTVFLKKESYRKLVMSEIATLIRLRSSPHVAQLLQYFETEDSFHLVMEFCAGGTLMDLALTRTRALRERQLARFARLVITAICDLHQHGIVHRDIKPDNIALTSRDLKTTDVKLIDLGLAAEIPVKSQPLQSFVGTPFFMAPEILRRRYNEKCDLWSAGITIYGLASREMPFIGRSDRELLVNICKAPIPFESPCWQFYSNALRGFLKALLTRDPLRRMSARQALQHKWLLFEGPSPSTAVNNDVLSKLQTFAMFSPLKRIVLVMVALRANETIQHSFFELYLDFDADGDQQVSWQDFYSVLRDLDESLDSGDIARLFERLNITHEEVLSPAIFIAALLPRCLYFSAHSLHSIFDQLDINGDGMLCQADVAMAVPQLLQTTDQQRYFPAQPLTFHRFMTIVTGNEQHAY